MFNVLQVGTQVMQQLGYSPKEQNTRKQAVINKKHTWGINTELWQTGYKREDAQGLNTQGTQQDPGRQETRLSIKIKQEMTKLKLIMKWKLRIWPSSWNGRWHTQYMPKKWQGLGFERLLNVWRVYWSHVIKSEISHLADRCLSYTWAAQCGVRVKGFIPEKSDFYDLMHHWPIFIGMNGARTQRLYVL